MELETFEITLGDTLVGHVYRYAKLTKLMFAESYISDAKRPVLSTSFAVPGNEAATRTLLSRFTQADRTGEGGKLPNFLSNALPEGALRDRMAALAGTHRDDEFAILAACAQDLPGAVRVRAINAPDRQLMQRLVTQDQDALEVSVVPRPDCWRSGHSAAFSPSCSSARMQRGAIPLWPSAAGSISLASCLHPRMRACLKWSLPRCNWHALRVCKRPIASWCRCSRLMAKLICRTAMAPIF
ncbi:MAG: hypothetical protein HC765_12710 [Brachymonas sp.]|nr:hypothetical protein [Brachymonas sp.]